MGGSADVVDAAQTNGLGGAFQNPDGSGAGVHVEIIVAENEITVRGVNFHIFGVGIGVNGDFVAVYFVTQIGILEIEVLGTVNSTAPPETI